MKNCSTVTVLLKDELTKFIGLLSLNNPKFYIFIDFGNISKCRILNNTTFYSNSQNLTEIKNELLEAKLVNRIIFTSGIQGKKLILIPLTGSHLSLGSTVWYVVEAILNDGIRNGKNNNGKFVMRWEWYNTEYLA